MVLCMCVGYTVRSVLLIAVTPQKEWPVSVGKVQKESECFHAETGGSSIAFA